jgi:hypothetical protein
MDHAMLKDQPTFGPAGTLDAEDAYLFQCGDDRLYAVTLDSKGDNLPPRTCPSGWKFLQAFPLGIREPLPMSISPEPVIRGIRSVGYYIWREGYGRDPSATSQ